MPLFRRAEREVRRWYRKKRWWILLGALSFGAYNNFAPEDAALREQLNSLLDRLP